MRTRNNVNRLSSVLDKTINDIIEQEKTQSVPIISDAKKSKFKVLTNDPSLTAWGWAVINENGIVLEAGCIKTESQTTKMRIRAGDDRTRRIGQILNVLVPVIREHKIDYILSELPHGSQNYNAAVMVGMVPGIIETLSACFDVAVEWFSESDSKKCILGRGEFSKQDMVKAIHKVFPEYAFSGIKYKDEAIADALAIYHTASKNSSTLKIFKNQVR